MSEPTVAPERGFLRIQQAAALAGVHPDTITRAIKAKKLPAYRPGGSRVVVVAVEDLLNWVRWKPIEPRPAA
jgi:excisionase family DNA binding protein